MKIMRNVLDDVIEHARQRCPQECCGLLAGRENLVERAVRCDNERQSGSEFSVPAVQLFEFFRSLRETGESFQGIYHSHPETGAFPSIRDAREFFYPEVSYWIVSLQEVSPVVRCFKWAGDGFRQVGFTLVSASHGKS